MHQMCIRTENHLINQSIDRKLIGSYNQTYKLDHFLFQLLNSEDFLLGFVLFDI